MRIVVASHNPAKTEAAKSAFEQMYPDTSIIIIKVDVSTGVEDQPKTDAETLRGAENRCRAAKITEPNADYWVGVEGGVDLGEHEVMAFAWAVVMSDDLIGKSRTATFVLPPQICALIHEGKTLGQADDIVFNRHDARTSDGAIGLMTGGLISRKSYHQEAILLALIPHKNRSLYLP
jgi:inosine/xanthosine triphosphatase